MEKSCNRKESTRKNSGKVLFVEKGSEPRFLDYRGLRVKESEGLVSVSNGGCVTSQVFDNEPLAGSLTASHAQESFCLYIRIVYE